MQYRSTAPYRTVLYRYQRCRNPGFEISKPRDSRGYPETWVFPGQILNPSYALYVLVRLAVLRETWHHTVEKTCKANESPYLVRTVRYGTVPYHPVWHIKLPYELHASKTHTKQTSITPSIFDISSHQRERQYALGANRWTVRGFRCAAVFELFYGKSE